MVASDYVTDGSNQYTFTGGTEGQIYYATVTAISSAGVSSNSPISSDPGAPNPESATTPVKLLAANADEDGDGQSNAAEDSAGTNPLSSASVFKALSVAVSGNDVNLTFATVPGKTYQLETSTTLLPGSWSNVGSPTTAVGTSTPFTHSNGASDPKRLYRARIVP